MNEKRGSQEIWLPALSLSIYLDYFLPSRTKNIDLFNNKVLLAIVSLITRHPGLPVWPLLPLLFFHLYET